MSLLQRAHLSRDEGRGHGEGPSALSVRLSCPAPGGWGNLVRRPAALRGPRPGPILGVKEEPLPQHGESGRPALMAGSPPEGRRPFSE